jgi:MFS family permease
MDRISRSFRLVRQSYRILMQDSELMFLPFIAGLITLAAGFGIVYAFGVFQRSADEIQAEEIVPLFLFCVLAYGIGIFFQAAVVAGATERLRGGDPTMRSAIAAAWRRVGTIAIWAVIAATIGVILDAIHERAGWLGKIVTSLLGWAWSFATFFIVPVLVLEQHSVGDSFDRSYAIFKKTWGEAVIGRGGLGLAAFFAWVALILVVMALAGIGLEAVAFIVAFTGAITLLMFFAALQGVYVASLYRFAIEGNDTAGFDRDLLADAFVPK